MHRQTHGAWSAPLDDVFIHFDYARATARGYPVPVVGGQRLLEREHQRHLPVRAGGRLPRRLPRPLDHALGGDRRLRCRPSASSSAARASPSRWAAGRSTSSRRPSSRSGALDWSLFSGMENAFHLGDVGPRALGRARRGPRRRGRPPRCRCRGWLAGAAGALLFATRPESVVCVAAFARARRGGGAARERPRRRGLAHARPHGRARRARPRGPGGREPVFTGEWAANGAIAKLGSATRTCRRARSGTSTASSSST